MRWSLRARLTRLNDLASDLESLAEKTENAGLGSGAKALAKVILAGAALCLIKEAIDHFMSGEWWALC